ncbi:hypothetical protein DY000_02039725 [Brassica cretica]|uniref:Uncharacterized protein n=1 Tax=Brassica cretica TaxID=69181 RepID=A0ABQ7BFA7_BRACR|nr:hypothetical protein DY000_02039725 [Brassica cretica]
MSSSQNDKKGSDAEMAEASSQAPELTSSDNAPACVAGFLSFREKMAHRKAEKETACADAELPSSSVLVVAPTHEPEVQVPQGTGAQVETGVPFVPDALAQPSGSSTTPILIEGNEKATESMPPPPARKEIVLALRAPSATPIVEPKGRKRKCVRGNDGESSQHEGLNLASGLRGKFVSLIDGMIRECGSEVSRLARDLTEMQGRLSESGAMLKALEDSHSAKVSKLEIQIGELERDLGRGTLGRQRVLCLRRRKPRRPSPWRYVDFSVRSKVVKGRRAVRSRRPRMHSALSSRPVWRRSSTFWAPTSAFAAGAMALLELEWNEWIVKRCGMTLDIPRSKANHLRNDEGNPSATVQVHPNQMDARGKDKDACGTVRMNVELVGEDGLWFGRLGRLDVVPAEAPIGKHAGRLALKMSSSQNDKKSSDAEMAEASSQAPESTPSDNAPAWVTGFLSFREKMARRKAEKETVRTDAELPSYSVLVVAPTHEPEVQVPQGTGAQVETGVPFVPDALAQPFGSSTTPILTEGNEKATESMPPPPARKEIVLASRAPSDTPVVQPKGRKKSASGATTGNLRSMKD